MVLQGQENCDHACQKYCEYEHEPRKLLQNSTYISIKNRCDRHGGWSRKVHPGCMLCILGCLMPGVACSSLTCTATLATLLVPPLQNNRRPQKTTENREKCWRPQFLDSSNFGFLKFENHTALGNLSPKNKTKMLDQPSTKQKAVVHPSGDNKSTIHRATAAVRVLGGAHDCDFGPLGVYNSHCWCEMTSFSFTWSNPPL